MNVCLFILVFCACACVDLLYVYWTSAVHAKRVMLATAASAGIQLVGIGMVLLVIDARWLLVPNVLGHAAGSYIGVRWPP